SPLSSPERLRSPGERGDTRDELVVAQRLRQKVVGADQQARHTVDGRRAISGDDDDSERVSELISQPPTDDVAAEHREVHVQHDGAGLFLACDLDRLRAALGLAHLEAGSAERSRRLRARYCVAVSNKNAYSVAVLTHVVPPGPWTRVRSLPHKRILLCDAGTK